MSITRQDVHPRAGFETLDDEVVVDDLPVSGRLPDWLAGTLLRNGPGAFEAGDRPLRHWFDGMAMLHRFTFAGGRVSYANRFLRTRAYRAAREEGRLAYAEFATDPCRSLFRRVTTLFDNEMSDNALVNVTTLGERYLAMSETPLPVVFDPGTLAQLGYAENAPGRLSTAHPHRDPATGDLINVAVHFGARSAYRFYRQSATGGPQVIASLPARNPGYVHSFAMSQRYIALSEFPLLVNPLQLALGDKPFIESYRWQPERGTRFLVVDRLTGERRGVFEWEAAFAFHHVAAFDDGDELVIDLCDHRTSEVIKSTYLDRLRQDVTGRQRVDAKLRRVRLHIPTGRVRSEILNDDGFEIPRINEDRCYLRPYRYVYGMRVSAENSFEVSDLLVKVDVETGDAAVWDEDGCYPGEAVFVPAPGGRNEDDGVALSVVLDAIGERSFLLVLDARTWSEVARVEAPHVVPHGFHGMFSRD